MCLRQSRIGWRHVRAYHVCFLDGDKFWTYDYLEEFDKFLPSYFYEFSALHTVIHRKLKPSILLKGFIGLFRSKDQLYVDDYAKWLAKEKILLITFNRHLRKIEFYSMPVKFVIGP